MATQPKGPEYLSIYIGNIKLIKHWEQFKNQYEAYPIYRFHYFHRFHNNSG